MRVLTCLWRGTDLPSYSADVYDASYVRNLRRACNRNGALLTLLHDEHYASAAEDADEAVPLAGHGVGGWSNVLEMFRPCLWPESGERHVAVGLDTILVGRLDWLFAWHHAPVGLPMDPYQKATVCDAVISWDRAGAALVWAEFQDSLKDGMKRHHYAGRPSEMALLRDLWGRAKWPTFDDTHPGELLSYKAHVCKGRKDWRRSSVVYFHGEPKPADLDPSDPLRGVWEA